MKDSTPRRKMTLLSFLLLVENFQGCHSLSTAAPDNNKPSNIPAKRKGYRVCTASPCSPNGSELLLEALQQLATDETALKEDYCLGGCCSGTVVKPIGQTNPSRRTLPVMTDETTAIETAQELLQEIEALDSAKLKFLRDKLADGERVLENSNDPDFCQNCGVGLQLYRGNCAKCGKYPY